MGLFGFSKGLYQASCCIEFILRLAEFRVHGDLACPERVKTSLG